MKRVSFRNLSLLGLVLMGASAVTAAILPKSNTKTFATGQIMNQSVEDGNGPRTCREGGINNDCDFTATDNAVNSFTTRNGVTSTDIVNSTGATNTGTNVRPDGTLASSEQ